MDTPEKTSPADRLGAQYLEISRAEFAGNVDQILGTVVPPGLNTGSEDDPGDLKFRFFNLPDDPQKRAKVIQQIQARGTDRLDPSVTSRYDILYQTAAKKAGVDPLDVMDVMNGADLRRYLPTIINPPDVTHLASNALLVYDGKTSTGLRPIDAREYTFKDASQRQKALLAIIGFK